MPRRAMLRRAEPSAASSSQTAVIYGSDTKPEKGERGGIKHQFAKAAIRASEMSRARHSDKRRRPVRVSKARKEDTRKIKLRKRVAKRSRNRVCHKRATVTSSGVTASKNAGITGYATSEPSMPRASRGDKRWRSVRALGLLHLGRSETQKGERSSEPSAKGGVS